MNEWSFPTASFTEEEFDRAIEARCRDLKIAFQRELELASVMNFSEQTVLAFLAIVLCSVWDFENQLYTRSQRDAERALKGLNTACSHCTRA
jgi:hypothetical protein